MFHESGQCPICKTNRVQLVFKDLKTLTSILECPQCGKFNISLELSQDLQSFSPFPEQKTPDKQSLVMKRMVSPKKKEEDQTLPFLACHVRQANEVQSRRY